MLTRWSWCIRIIPDGKEAKVRFIMLRFIAACALIALPFRYAVGQANSSEAAVPASSSANSDASILPDGPGKELVQKKCLTCHNARIVSSKRGDEDGWAEIVSQMIGRGAILSDDDAESIVEYMAAHFGPSVPKSDEAAPPPQGSQPASSTGSEPAPANADQASDAKGPVNVNKAAADELESRLKLTQAEALAVVHYREQNGEFKNLQQLLSVPGIDTEKIKNGQKQIAF
jgi:competence protein ComEA